MRDLSDSTIGSEEEKGQIIRSARLSAGGLDEPVIGNSSGLPKKVEVYDTGDENWVPLLLGEYEDKKHNRYFFLGILDNMENSKNRDKSPIFYAGKAQNLQTKKTIDTYLHLSKGEFLTDNPEYHGLPILKNLRGFYDNPEKDSTDLYFGGHPKNNSALKQLEENNLVVTDLRDFLDNYGPPS